jgi:hypothetical protein
LPVATPVRDLASAATDGLEQTMSQSSIAGPTTTRSGLFSRHVLGARRIPLLLYGILAFCFGVAMYLTGIAMSVPRILLGLNATLLPLNEWIVWYSGMPITLGFVLTLTDLFLFFPARRVALDVREDPIEDRRVTVALTAYNDELSIAAAVEDFRSHPLVRDVIVVSNNSTDATLERATLAGAIAVNERRQGYGQCVYRCYQEAIARGTSELIVLCEGDRTFRASDLEKFLAYAPHADIVNGTRTVERLRQHKTQLSTFMYYGNLFVGKLLEAKHLGRSTITDVGTTYKLCRRDALVRLMPHLNPGINLEFNAFFLDKALETGLAVVEVPITFHNRVGVSKGGNIDDLRALKVGCRMILGIIGNWKRLYC